MGDFVRWQYITSRTVQSSCAQEGLEYNGQAMDGNLDRGLERQNSFGLHALLVFFRGIVERLEVQIETTKNSFTLHNCCRDLA
jgi:hypothetical protein